MKRIEDYTEEILGGLVAGEWGKNKEHVTVVLARIIKDKESINTVPNPIRKLRNCFSEVLEKWIDKETNSIHLSPCDHDYQTLIGDMVLAVNKAEYNPIVSIDSIRQVMTEVLTKHNVVEIDGDEIDGYEIINHEG